MTTAKPTKQDELREKLARWERLKLKQNRINAQADGQLEDLYVTFEKKAEPINAERDRQLQGVIEDLAALEKEISDELLREIKPDGTFGLPQIETKHALAQVLAASRREIDAATFFRVTPPRRRSDAAFFECLTVQIGKAEKFLDQPTMARLTKLKVTPSVAVTLKKD